MLAIERYKKQDANSNTSQKVKDNEVKDLVALQKQAQEAMENYNFEEAKNLYLHGLTECGGEPLIALPLLELLVETLGSWQEAISLEPHLSTKSRGHETIQLLMAQAYQELGDVSNAEGYLRGVQNPRAASIYGMMAQQQMTTGNLDEAHRLLKLAQNLAQGGYLQECAELNHRLYQMKLDKVKDQATEMRQLFEQGNSAQALAKAYRLLEAIPNHPEAVTLIKQVNALKENQKRDELIKTIALAKSENSYARELVAIEQLLAQQTLFDDDTDRMPLESRLAELKEFHQKEKAQNLVRIIEEALTQNDLETALDIFLDADESIQRQLLHADRVPLLAAAMELVHHVKHSRHPEVRQAFLEVYRLKQRTDDELGVAPTNKERVIQQALERLKQHSALLEALPSIRAWEVQLKSELQQLAEVRWLQTVSLLENRLRTGEFAQAEQLWATLDRSRVPMAAKEKLVAIEQELQAYREEENLHREFAEALESEQYLEARQWAEKLLALAHDEDQKRLWKEHVVRLQRALNEQWKLKRFQNPELDNMMINSLLRHSSRELICGAHPEGSEVIVPLGVGPAIFLFVISTETRALKEVVTLCGSSTKVSFVDIIHEGERLCLTFDSEKILWVNRATWDIMNSFSVPTAITRNRILEAMEIQPYGSLAWLSLSGSKPLRANGEETLVYDINTNSVIRRRSFAPGALLIREGRDTKLLVSRAKELQLFDFQGRMLDSVPFRDKDVVTSVGRSPNQQGFLLGHYFDSYGSETEQEDGEFTISLWQGNELKRLGVLEEVNATFQHCFITLEALDGFLICYQGINGNQLKAMKLGDSDQLEILWTLDLEEVPVFITDVSCNRSFALQKSKHTVELVPLTTDPPQFKTEKTFEKLPSLNDRYQSCAQLRGPKRAKSLAINAAIEDLESTENLQDFMKKQMAHSGDNANDLFALYVALKDSLKLMRLPSHRRPGSHVWATLKERFPDSSYVKLESGIRALAENDPLTAKDYFAAVNAEDLDSIDQIHYHHVYGNALSLLNDFDGAFSLWQKGRGLQVELHSRDIHSEASVPSTLEDRGDDVDNAEDSELDDCPLGDLLNLLEFSKQPEFDHQKNQDEMPVSPLKFSRRYAVVSFLRHIYCADQALAQGDFAKALALYQTMNLPKIIPLQIAARWTRILLQLAKQQPPLSSSSFELQLLFHCQNLLKVSDLSRKSAYDRELAQPLPPPLENWPEADLERLRVECAAWLSKHRITALT